MRRTKGRQPNVACCLCIGSAAGLLLPATPCKAGEIHQAVGSGNIAKLRALLEKKPELVNRMGHQQWRRWTFVGFMNRLEHDGAPICLGDRI